MESVIIDGRIILKQILKINWMFYLLSFSYVKITGFCEYETTRNIFRVFNLLSHKLLLILYYERMYNSLEYLLGDAY